MPEDIVLTSPNSGTGDSAGSPDGAQEVTPQALREEIVKIESAFGDRLQSQSAIIGKLTNAIETLRKQLDGKQADPAPESGKAKKEDPFAERFKEFEKAQSAQKKAAKIAAMRETLASNGMDAEAARVYGRMLTTEHEASMAAELNEYGEYVISVNETPIADWVSAYLESDEGKLLRGASKTAPKNPHPGMSTKKTAPASSGKKQVSPFEYSKLAAQAVARGRAEGKSAKSFLEGFEVVTD